MKVLRLVKVSVFVVLLATMASSLVLVPTADAATKTKKKKTNRGAVQFTVREELTVKSGKKTKKVYKNRGNVLVELRRTPKGGSTACRDGLIKKITPKFVYSKQNIPKPNAPKVVFAHKTDANPRNVKNIGKVKIDSCTVGTYVPMPRLSAQYTVANRYKPGLPVKPIVIKKGKATKVTITIKKTKKAAAATPLFSKIPLDKLVDRLPLPENSESLDDFEGEPVDPNDPENGISAPEGEFPEEDPGTVPPTEDGDESPEEEY